MGVLNVTHDSFSDGGQFANADEAIAFAIRMFEDGADIVDIGGESTNPFGSEPLSADDETARVLPVVKALVRRGFRQLSIDTRQAEVARICLLEGASWINDVSAMTYDEHMVHEAKKADAVVLMHARGIPQVMQKDVVYSDVVYDVANYLRKQVALCEESGITKDRIVVDPGICFGKKLEHNVALLRGLEAFQGIGAGVLSGVSRKSFLGEITGIKDPKARENATLGAVAYSALKGANILRVHNVKANREMLTVFEALNGGLKS
jgi:dihydropteroate synthase